MGVQRLSTLAILFSAAAALFVPGQLAGLLPPTVRAAVVAAGVFYLPGLMLARGCGARLTRVGDALALAFTLSLAMLVPAAAVAFATGKDAVFAAAMLMLVTCIAAAVERARGAHVGVGGGETLAEKRGLTWL